MAEFWIKVGLGIAYLFITGVLWLVVGYCESVVSTPYNDDVYFVKETEATGKFVSVKRLVIGLALVLVGAYLWTKGLKTIWLLLYGQADILGLALLLTSVRVHRVLHLVSEYPGIPDTIATSDDALIGCWSYLIVVIFAVLYTIAVLFL